MFADAMVVTINREAIILWDRSLNKNDILVLLYNAWNTIETTLNVFTMLDIKAP